MELVIVNNGKATTTSMVVAEYFGKQHKHVLDAIRRLMEDQEVSARLIFRQCFKINELANGKSDPDFERA